MNMDFAWIELLFLMMSLINFRMLGASQLGSVINFVALQGILLALLPLTTASQLSPEVFSVILLFFVLHGLLMPWLLRREIRPSSDQRETRPIVGLTASMFVGVLLLGAAFYVSHPLMRSYPAVAGTLALPASLFTFMSGLFLLVARRMVLLQVLGYLIMTNGILAFGVTFVVYNPLLVESGILLDLFPLFLLLQGLHESDTVIYHGGEGDKS